MIVTMSADIQPGQGEYYCHRLTCNPMDYCDITIGDCVSCLRLCISCKTPSPDCFLHCYHEYIAYCMDQSEMQRIEREIVLHDNITRPTPRYISVGNLHITPLILLVVGSLLSIVIIIASCNGSFWVATCFGENADNQTVSPILLPVKDNCVVSFCKTRNKCAESVRFAINDPENDEERVDIIMEHSNTDH